MAKHGNTPEPAMLAKVEVIAHPSWSPEEKKAVQRKLEVLQSMLRQELIEESALAAARMFADAHQQPGMVVSETFVIELK